MKRRVCLYITSLLLMLTVSGCVKDDSPYPEIDNTSWKRVIGEDWERLSFANNKVNHQIFQNSSLTEYTFDITQGNESGSHFYKWTNGAEEFKVYSLSTQYIVVLINYSSDFYRADPKLVFTRE